MIPITAINTHATARFWDRIANRYARKSVPNEEEYTIKLQKSRAAFRPTDHVLEIGCGTGTTALEHANDVATIHAIDISPEMIRIARQKAYDAGIENVTFDVSDIVALSATDTRYDVIMAHSILHLLPDVPATLRLLRHLLKPGGVLIANTPCIGDIAPWFRWVAPVGRTLRLLPHIAVFKDAAYRDWITESGFEIEQWWHPRPQASVYSIARSKP